MNEIVMTESDYYDIAIATTIDTSNLVSLLNDEAILGSWEQEGILHLYWPAEAWAEEKRKSLRELLLMLGDTPGAFTIEVSRCVQKDWNAQWAALVKPIRLGRRLLIRPSWEMVDSSPEAIEIILDPKQAFGTGHHATTQLLLEWLEEVIGGQERVLDVGTGSGILLLAALKLGARYGFGIDLDPIAIDCAKEYARVNQAGDNLQYRVQDLKTLDPMPFDIILANLDRRALLDEAPYFQRVGREGTLLLLSGILSEDQVEIRDRFVKRKWQLWEVRSRGEWVALGMKREAPS